MNKPVFEWRFLSPRYWPAWVGIFIVFVMAWLPEPVQRALGRGIGWLSWQLIGQRRSDTLVNLRLCYPELDEAAREKMARAVFRHAGQSLFETANAWFVPLSHYRKRVRFEGIEHVEAARAQGRGVLLLGAHYMSLDYGGAVFSTRLPIDTVYRPQNNPVFEYMMRRQRQRVYLWQIDHDNMRGLVKALKQNHIVWYTPDQDYGLKQGVMAPFFGVEAATITATARLARVNNSVVLFVHFYVRDDGGITMSFTPPLENYPSGDDVADATRVNLELEKLIRRVPEQYMWFHRRFKTRPKGDPQPYVMKRRQIREAKEEAAKLAAGQRAQGEKSE
jgi:KDO2-lipid IV(A) lauroyltransferase